MKARWIVGSLCVAMLIAVGILTCHLELVRTISSVEITKEYQFCPPTWDPYERRP